jgi:hypothetical protein
MTDLFEMLESRQRELRVAMGMPPDPTLRERFIDWWTDVDWGNVGFVAAAVAGMTVLTINLFLQIFIAYARFENLISR